MLSLFPRDFVALHPNVLKYRERIAVPLEQLQRYGCTFVASGQLQGTPLAQLLPDELGLERDFQGRIRLVDGALVIALAGMDVIGLEPIGLHRFRLLGGPQHMWVDFEVGAEGEVRALALVTPTEKLRIPAVSQPV